MTKNIIIRPVISEKAERMTSKDNKYCFIVRKDANKLQIAAAIGEMFPDVTVKGVNTHRTVGKVKGRSTRSGYLKGKLESLKKAVVTLSDGDELDIYGAEVAEEQ